jgi:1,2-diacylglycerol 3-alpha-glucosyltransferase
MRILMISDVYFPRVNGVSTSIQTCARELIALGHQVTLIAPDYGRDAEHETDCFPIYRIPSHRLPLDPEDRLLRPAAIRALVPRLRGEEFDLLHIHTPFVAHYAGLALARRLRLPVMETYHTYFEEYLDKYIPFLPKALLRCVARRFSRTQCAAVDALAVPSRAMLEVLRGYGVTTRAEVIPTGIDLDQFSRGDGSGFRAHHGIPPQRPTLVHVGRLAFEKNQEFLLEVLSLVRAEVPDVLLVLAGEGPARPGLERLGRALGLANHLLFVGYLGRNGPLEDCYRAGDAFVFSSRTETQGLVLLEAMALGVPVISTAVMGTREVLHDGRGALVAEEDKSDFAAKVVRLLRDPALKEALGRRARSHAQEWSAPALTARLQDLYQGLCRACAEDEQAQAPADATAV